jgi:hypothetical protein
MNPQNLSTNLPKIIPKGFFRISSKIIIKIISATRPYTYSEKVLPKLVTKRAFRFTDQLQACVPS